MFISNIEILPMGTWNFNHSPFPGWWDIENGWANFYEITTAQGNSLNAELINRIELVRTHNNKNWMDILRLALEYAPKQKVNVILDNIIRHDEEVMRIMKRMIGGELK